MLKLPKTSVLLVFAAATLVGSSAVANERHFTYTYETATLPKGAVEFEPWTTLRYGKKDYYLRQDHRFELEFGLTDTVQTAFYFNVSAYAKEVTDDLGNVSLEKKWKMPGISSEWKWKLMDPMADALGLALYVEGSLKPHEAEVESKILVDKRIGDLLVAFNAVGEYEWINKGDKVVTEVWFEFDLGLAYLPAPGWSVGLELRNTNFMPEMEEVTVSALFAGPVVSYATKKWWTTLTVLPQIYSFVGASDDTILNLEEHERVEARLLFGIHI